MLSEVPFLYSYIYVHLSAATNSSGRAQPLPGTGNRQVIEEGAQIISAINHQMTQMVKGFHNSKEERKQNLDIPLFNVGYITLFLSPARNNTF